MSTVRITVTAWREGRWWVIDVPGYGVTQARSRARIEPMARDLIEALSGPTDVALTESPPSPHAAAPLRQETTMSESAQIATHGGRGRAVISSSGPVHTRATWMRPVAYSASVADPPRFPRPVMLRSSCGHVLGVGWVWHRQRYLAWKRCRS